MSKDDVDAFQRNLMQLAPARVQDIYREAWERCRMIGNNLPEPEAVQQLVQAWKTLWGWRRHR